MFLFTLAQKTQDDGVFIHSRTKDSGRWCFYSLLHKGLRTMVFLFTLAQRTEDDGVFIHPCTKE